MRISQFSSLLLIQACSPKVPKPIRHSFTPVNQTSSTHWRRISSSRITSTPTPSSTPTINKAACSLRSDTRSIWWKDFALPRPRIPLHANVPSGHQQLLHCFQQPEPALVCRFVVGLARPSFTTRSTPHSFATIQRRYHSSATSQQLSSQSFSSLRTSRKKMIPTNVKEAVQVVAQHLPFTGPGTPPPGNDSAPNKDPATADSNSSSKPAANPMIVGSGQATKRYQPAIDTKSGAFVRPDSKHRYRIGSTDFPAEADRYICYIALACPWASRVTAVIDIMGLDDKIEVVSVAAEMKRTKPEDEDDEHVGWVFAEEKQGRYIRPDPVFGAKTLREIYERCGDFKGKFTTPLLLDKKTKRIVNNESSEIIRMLNQEFAKLARHPFDLYPVELRPTIDEVNEWVYHNINNGVYRAGFAQSQQAYDEAVTSLFDHLDKAEAILSKMRYLCSDKLLTEADIRLFETLVRFDHVYHTHFKCNIKSIRDYPNLSNFTREIYRLVPNTVDIEEIKAHYFKSHRGINPYAIVARGPPVDFHLPHDRDEKFPFESKTS